MSLSKALSMSYYCMSIRWWTWGQFWKFVQHSEKKGHFGQCGIDFENNLTEKFISTSRVLEEEKLPDLPYMKIEWLYYPIQLDILKIVECRCKEM